LLEFNLTGQQKLTRKKEEKFVKRLLPKQAASLLRFT